jgi:hypothetical protein
MIFGQIDYGSMPNRLPGVSGNISLTPIYSDIQLLPITDVWTKQCCNVLPAGWVEVQLQASILIKCTGEDLKT